MAHLFEKALPISAHREGSGNPPQALRRLRMPRGLFPQPRPFERTGVVPAVAPDAQRGFRQGVQGVARGVSGLGRRARRAHGRHPGNHLRRHMAGAEGAAHPADPARHHRATGRRPVAGLPCRHAGDGGAGVAGDAVRGRAEDQRRRPQLQHAAPSGPAGGQPPSPRRGPDRHDPGDAGGRSRPCRAVGAASRGLGRSADL